MSQDRDGAMKSDRDIERLLKGDADLSPPADLFDLLRAEIPENLGEEAPGEASDAEAPAPLPFAPEPTGRHGQAEPGAAPVPFRRRGSRRWLLAAAGVILAAGMSLLTLRLVSPGAMMEGLAESDMAVQSEPAPPPPPAELRESAAKRAPSTADMAEPMEQEESSANEFRVEPGEPSAPGDVSLRLAETLSKKDLFASPSLESAPETSEASGALEDGAALGGATARDRSDVDSTAADSFDLNLSPPSVGASRYDRSRTMPRGETENNLYAEKTALFIEPEPALGAEAEEGPESLDEEERKILVDLDRQEREAPELLAKSAPASPAPELRSAQRAREVKADERFGDVVDPDSHPLWRSGALWAVAAAELEAGELEILDPERARDLRSALTDYPSLSRLGARLLDLWQWDPESSGARGAFDGRRETPREQAASEEAPRLHGELQELVASLQRLSEAGEPGASEMLAMARFVSHLRGVHLHADSGAASN